MQGAGALAEMSQQRFRSRPLELDYVGSLRRKRSRPSFVDGHFTTNWDEYDDDLIPGLPNSIFCDSIWPKLFGGQIDAQKRVEVMLPFRVVSRFWQSVVDDCEDMFQFQLRVNVRHWLGDGRKGRMSRMDNLEQEESEEIQFEGELAESELHWSDVYEVTVEEPTAVRGDVEAMQNYPESRTESTSPATVCNSNTLLDDQDVELSIPDCSGLTRDEWLNKSVTIISVDGVPVGNAVVRACQPSNCVDDRELGVDDVGVLIIDSLSSTHIPPEWRFSLRRWPCRAVLYEGVSLFDHLRRHVANTGNNEENNSGRVGVRRYNNANRQTGPLRPDRLHRLLSEDAILGIVGASCCPKMCTQKFSPEVLKTLRHEMWSNSFKMRRHMQLDVHRHTFKECGRKYVVLENVQVCQSAWRTIMHVSKSDFFRKRSEANDGLRTRNHGNLGTKKSRVSTRQAVASLQCIIDSTADIMPHRFRTTVNGDRLVERVLPAGTKWKDILQQINQVNTRLGLNTVSPASLSFVRRTEFRHVTIKRRGDMFARCGTCDKKKQLRDAHPVGSANYLIYEAAFKKHIAEQEAHRQAYYGSRWLSTSQPEKVVTIIHDKMDHSKTASPCLANRTKITEGFGKLPVSVTGMIAHGHGDGKYAHFSLDLFPADSNHTVGSIAKLLRDLEITPAKSSGVLFENSGSTPLFEAVLSGKEICVDVLERVADPVPAKPLPPVLHVQLDNCWKDNKSRYVFCFWSLLVANRVFKEVQVSFLLVGHTHEDIDASFGRWSAKLKEEDQPSVPALMKSFMNCDPDSQQIIPHLIEELPDFKSFVLPFVAKDKDSLIGHSKGQQFLFTMRDGEPIMQYKIQCNELTWKPRDGIKLWRVGADGRQQLPRGEPIPVAPIPMKNHDDIVKGLTGFINMWESISRQDTTGVYSLRRSGLISYWRVVRDTLLLAPSPRPSALRHGFWPVSRISSSVDDTYNVDGTVREEFDVDEHYIGPVRYRPQPSFRVATDCGIGYMLLVRPGDGESVPKPVWVGEAVSDPVLSSSSEHFRHIQIQYYTPTSTAADVVRHYKGWNKGKLKWKPDPNQRPDWIHTDSLLTAWKPRKGDSRTIPIKQATIAKDNLSRCAEAEEPSDED